MTKPADHSFPPAAAGLPAGTLEAAEIGANRLDAWARSPQGRNFLAHALVQLARTGWLRAEPGEGWEPVADRQPVEPAVSSAGQAPATETAPSHRAELRDQIAGVLWPLTDWDGDELNAVGAADAVLAVLYREWPWLRAEAEDAGTAVDQAAAIASCPGYEASPSPCRCPCYGCKHHCSAHNPDDVPATDQTREQIAEAALAAVETALNDTLLPEAREEALAGIAAVLPAPADQAAELASLAVNAGRALQDEKRHYEIACQENARLRATINRVRRLHDALDEETALTSPDDEITRGAAARKIAAALDGWTDPAELRRLADQTPAAEAVAPGLAEVEEALADGSVRCPLCPTPITLHTPNGARAHFTTVHPEQRITGRGTGPWPLLAADQAPATKPKRPPMDPVHILGIDADDRPAAGPVGGCAECGHPEDSHTEREEPVSVGRCTACPDDDRHDYQPAAARQDGASQ